MHVNQTGAAGLAILRLTVGVIFMSHGIPKLLGGIPGTAEFLGQVGIPAPGLAAWAVALLEVGGGLLLILGLFVVPVAILFILHMTLGILLVHLAQGWYVVGPGQGGAEFNTLLIAASLALALGGPGLWALGSRASDDEPAAHPGTAA